MNKDILIIGAGVIGMMSALECRRAGASVALLDMSSTGREASWAGGGILSPLYPWRESEGIHALHRWSEQQYPLLASELYEATGIDIEWNRCGMLVADVCDQVLAETRLLKREIQFKWVDRVELNRTHSGLSLTGSRSLMLPKIAQIRNPRLLKALKNLLLQQQVALFERHQVTELIFNKSKSRIESIQTPHGQFSADSIILAAGAWSQQLWPDLGSSRLPVFPVKGQMLLIKARQGIVPSIVLDENQYIIPRKDGHLLVGSTVEQTNFNKIKTVFAKRQLKQFFDRLYPTLNSLPVIQHWAGIRPGSTGNPIICKHPQIENLYVNSGHFRNGLNLAPASARLVVDIITGHQPIVATQAYRV